MLVVRILYYLLGLFGCEVSVWGCVSYDCVLGLVFELCSYIVWLVI